ncbi:MAG: site-2 protease family protein [Chloroflexi bacterium]|nr:site-2 protease family protein [Chloroflexota bacterium]
MSDSTSLTFISPGQPERADASRFPWLNLILLLATMVSTMLVGTFLAANGLFGNIMPPIMAGFLFAATLLLVLGAHELGHYFVAQLHGVDASLPYFIPAPLGLGTLGAFIRMKAPVPNRRALFDVGLAGPLAGLAVALPLFAAGLILSPVRFQQSFYGNGLLVEGLIWLTEFVRGTPPGHHLILHPISFAAYVGLFITAINLLPAGQMDGGHVAYALFGRRAYWLSIISVIVLLVLGWSTGWFSWYIWALLVMLLGLRHPPTLNDAIPIRGIRWLLGIIALLTMIILFASDPFPIFR